MGQLAALHGKPPRLPPLPFAETPFFALSCDPCGVCLRGSSYSAPLRFNPRLSVRGAFRVWVPRGLRRSSHSQYKTLPARHWPQPPAQRQSHPRRFSLHPAHSLTTARSPPLRPCSPSLPSSSVARLPVPSRHVGKSAERASVGLHVLAPGIAIAPAPPVEPCPAASSSAAPSAGRTGRCHVQQCPWTHRQAQSTRAGTPHPFRQRVPCLMSVELLCKGRADYPSIPNHRRAHVPTRHNRKTHEQMGNHFTKGVLKLTCGSSTWN